MHKSGTHEPYSYQIQLLQSIWKCRAEAAQEAEIKKFSPFCHQVQLEEDKFFCPNKSLTWTPHTTNDWGSKCNQHFLIMTMREMQLKPWADSDFLLPSQKGLTHLIASADSCIWTLAVVGKKSSLMSNYKESQEKVHES